MGTIEPTVHYNGFAKCFSTVDMDYAEAKKWSFDNREMLRCQKPSGMAWWYFKNGSEVDSDVFYDR